MCVCVPKQKLRPVLKVLYSHEMAHILEGAPIARESVSHGFDPHMGRSVVSLSKTLHPSCLVLVKPIKPSQND